MKIVEPVANQVRMPLTVRWTADRFDGYFAVFFDQSPMRPNGSLISLVPENDSCRSDPGCPSAAWLADHYVYVTKASHLVVTALADNRPNHRGEDRHQVTIVLLDNAGKRMGESAFREEFIVKRTADG